MQSKQLNTASTDKALQKLSPVTDSTELNAQANGVFASELARDQNVDAATVSFDQANQAALAQKIQQQLPQNTSHPQQITQHAEALLSANQKTNFAQFVTNQQWQQQNDTRVYFNNKADSVAAMSSEQRATFGKGLGAKYAQIQTSDEAAVSKLDVAPAPLTGPAPVGAPTSAPSVLSSVMASMSSAPATSAATKAAAAAPAGAPTYKHHHTFGEFVSLSVLLALTAVVALICLGRSSNSGAQNVYNKL